MSLMNTFQKDFSRFQFPGFGQVGTCFLRARVNPDGTAVFLCAQLKNYTGTSVTNAVEDIFVNAASTLEEAGVFKPKRAHWYSFRRELNIVEVAARSRWVEFYPKGTGISCEDSYALVSFDSDLRPVWNYVSLERAIKVCGVGPEFFCVPPEELQYAS